MSRTQKELCVSIPTFFRCPISLEVMKSPVSLSTGVTYDRSSIQTWLDGGHTTCPTTMQSLSSPSFVPNLTLHRLIHLWSLSHSLAPPSPRLQPKSLLANSHDLAFSLHKILDQATKSEDNRRILANSDDFIASIVQLMVTSDKIETLELIFLILDLIVEFNEGDEKIIHKLMNSNCLCKFVFVLRNGNLESKIAAAKIVQKMAIDEQQKEKGLLLKTPNLVMEMYNLVISSSDSSIEVGMSALIAITVTSKQAKMEVLKLGMVRQVGEILSNDGTGRRDATMMTQRAMEMLEVIATCTEGRKAISEDEKCVAEIERKLLKATAKTTEHGVTVLWSVCYLFRDGKVKEIVGKNNGLGKCLLLLQSDCSGIVRQMCRDLVKVLRVNFKSSLGGYDTKTTHIMPY